MVDWKRFILFMGIMLLLTGVMMIVYSDFVVTGWDPAYQKHMSSYFEAWRNIGIVLLSSGIVIIIGTGYSYLKQNR